MNAAVGIIGVGWVGASVAISTLNAGVAKELLLSDVRADVAEGEAIDLAHGASFYPAAGVRAAAVEEMMDTAAVVIAAGRGGKSGESRLDLLRDNVIGTGTMLDTARLPQILGEELELDPRSVHAQVVGEPSY